MIEAKDTIVTKILTECLDTHKTRHEQYGASEENFADLAVIATRLSLTGKKYTAIDVAMFMVAIKEVRYKYQFKLWNEHIEDEDNDFEDGENPAHNENVLHDSLVDWINYLAIAENVRRKQDQNNK